MKPVILIGHGGSGKTSLIKWLCGRKDFVKELPATDKVEISHDNENGIVYLDSAGQDRSFIPMIEPLSKLHSVTILTTCIDPERGLPGALRDRWLEVQKIIDPENKSSIILANTYCNTTGGDMPGRAGNLREEISATFNIDNRSGDGINDLKTKVVKLTRDIPGQNVEEKDFYYTNLAIKIIDTLNLNKNQIAISKDDLGNLLKTLDIKEDLNKIIAELEKLNILIVNNDKLIFPLTVKYHLYDVKNNALNPVMKMDSNSTKALIQLLAVRLGKYVTDIDPSIICLSTDPANKPNEVIIRIEDSFKTIVVSGEKNSNLLTIVQKEIVNFIKEKNLSDMVKVQVKCPCEECAKDKPISELTWNDYSRVVERKKSLSDKPFMCRNLGERIPLKDFQTFED